MNKNRTLSETELTNRGWANMEVLLEKEMPVKNKRRRFLFFWLFSGLLMAGLGGAFWRKTPENVQPMEEHFPKTQNPANAPAIQANIANADHSSTPTEPSATASIALEGTKQPAVSRQSQPTSSTATKTGHSTQQSNLTTIDWMEPGTATASNGAKTAMEPVLEPLNNPVAQPIHNALTSFDGLQMPNSTVSSATRFELPFKAMYESPTVIEPHRAANPIQWGLTAGLQSQNFSEFNGGFAGLAVQLNLGKMWGLQSGLAYNLYYKSPNRTNGLAKLYSYESYINENDLTDLDTNTIVPNPIAFDKTTAVVVVPVQKIHQLEMPVMAFFRPTPRMKILGGVDISYRFTKKNANDTDKNAGTASNSESTAVAPSFAKWNMRWQVGTQFQLAQGWEAGISYQSDLQKTAVNTKLGNAVIETGAASISYKRLGLARVSVTKWF